MLLSLAQRALSSHVRHVRRDVVEVDGALVLTDGHREDLDEQRLIAPAEGALRLLTAATVLLAAALVAVRL